MLHNLTTLLAPPVLERLTLVLNHVLAAEPQAAERMRVHQTRIIELELDGWPALLPAPPPLAWRVTPAGLLEWCGMQPQGTAELRAHLDASNPVLLLAGALTGERPALRVDGDAQLAADVDWLLNNLRWDVAADLERLFGRTMGAQLHRLGRSLAGALRSALRAAEPLIERFGPGPR